MVRRPLVVRILPIFSVEEVQMAFRPNYRFERMERDRLKKAKTDEKLRRQQERASQRQEPDQPENPEATAPPKE